MDWLIALDRAAQAWIVALPRSAALDAVLLAVSGFGWRGAGFIAIALVAALRWRGVAVMGAWRVVLAVTLAVVVTDSVLKPAVGRARPFEQPGAARVIGPHPTNASFPSGHAAASVAGAYALALLWRSRRRAWWTLAVLVCLSRLHLGVHYPLDVVGGALVGWACAYFATAGTKAVAPALPASVTSRTANGM
jgi:undecaprenyl-diphosphatase